MTFSYFLFFNMSRITFGMIKKKAGKNIYNPTDLEVALPRDLRGIKKKWQRESKIPKVHLTVSIK
jgi:hypothetical protein